MFVIIGNNYIPPDTNIDTLNVHINDLLGTISNERKKCIPGVERGKFILLDSGTSNDKSLLVRYKIKTTQILVVTILFKTKQNYICNPSLKTMQCS